MKNIPNDVYQKIIEIAIDLEINPDDLVKLIDFESGFDPQAKNPYSSARGLIQFVDKTARDLGFSDSLDLVTLHPTVKDQLQLVYEYLSRYYPFANSKELYLSVLYPSWRKKPLDTVLPVDIQIKNPGIVTLRDYVEKIEGRGKFKVDSTYLPAIAIALILLIIIISKGKK